MYEYYHEQILERTPDAILLMLLAISLEVFDGKAQRDLGGLSRHLWGITHENLESPVALPEIRYEGDATVLLFEQHKLSVPYYLHVGSKVRFWRSVVFSEWDDYKTYHKLVLPEKMPPEQLNVFGPNKGTIQYERFGHVGHVSSILCLPEFRRLWPILLLPTYQQFETRWENREIFLEDYNDIEYLDLFEEVIHWWGYRVGGSSRMIMPD